MTVWVSDVDIVANDFVCLLTTVCYADASYIIHT